MASTEPAVSALALVVPDSEAMRRIEVPVGFRVELRSLLAPGPTLMATDASILEHATGIEMTILTSHPDGV